VFAASIVVPGFHINLRLNVNNYQKKKQVKPGNSETKYFFGNMVVLDRKYFQIFSLQTLHLSSAVFMKPSTVTVVLRLNLH